MNSKIIYRPGLLQQQPRRPVNQQQQQSSGSGEFQPPRSRQLGQQVALSGRERQAGEQAVQYGGSAAFQRHLGNSLTAVSPYKESP